MADDEFFGSADGGLDLSDEALDARVADDGAEPDETIQIDSESPDIVVDEPPVEASEPVVEDVEGDTPDDIPEKLRGKTDADLRRMYLELEQQYGSKGNEVGELRTQAQQQAEQIEELRHYLINQQQQETGGELVDMVRSNPTGIYQQAIAALDNGQVTIDVVEEIIDEIRNQADEFSDEGEEDASRHYRKLARAMERDFDRRITLAEQRQHVAPMQQQHTVNAYREGVQQYFNTGSEDEIADARAYSTDVQNLLKGRQLGNDPAQIAHTLRQALVYVRGMNPTRSSAFIRQQNILKGSATAEQGNAVAPPVPQSEADEIRAALFARKDPADALFADFGGVK